MLEVHAPHEKVHSLRDFLVHIAAITIGLLLALGLESLVEWQHHRNEARAALERLAQEVAHNRLVLQDDMRLGDATEANHRAALAVLGRLRGHSLRPDDRLVFVRKYSRLNSSAWTVVRESGAGRYIPYEIMARYAEIYETQDVVNAMATSIYADLQRATSVLNTDQPDSNRAEADRMQRAAAEKSLRLSDPRTDLAAEQALDVAESGNPDLTRLSAAQVDRLEAGFQQAISDDRRLHRMYLFLDDLYAAPGH
jgi:hypothetical protein